MGIVPLVLRLATDASHDVRRHVRARPHGGQGASNAVQEAPVAPLDHPPHDQVGDRNVVVGRQLLHRTVMIGRISLFHTPLQHPADEIGQHPFDAKAVLLPFFEIAMRYRAGNTPGKYFFDPSVMVGKSEDNACYLIQVGRQRVELEVAPFSCIAVYYRITMFWEDI